MVLAGCLGDPGTSVVNRTVTAGCGLCLYSMPEAGGCAWAVEIDGTTYLATGALPRDHENHAPEGMCNMKRQVVVDGNIRGDRFVATRFDLQAPGTVPEKPRYTPEDEHP